MGLVCIWTRVQIEEETSVSIDLIECKKWDCYGGLVRVSFILTERGK